MKYIKSLALFNLYLFLSGCLSARAIPSPEPSGTPAAGRGAFRVIGYTPDWSTVVDEIQFDKLTHINYAFLVPNSDGTFADIEHPAVLKEIVVRAHAEGVMVLISVGGWGYDQQFEQLAADPQMRKTFREHLLRFMRDYDLDGADIDWEYPRPGGSADNYLALMSELRAALPDKLLTSAVAVWDNADGIPAGVFPLVDFLNIMAYDMTEADHSPYSFAEQALDYWSGRGLPQVKTVLGVPFYGRPGGLTYRKLVASDPAAAIQDIFPYQGSKVYYNGIPTLQRKTRLAMQRASGIMIWELSQDSLDSNSLLSAIHQTVNAQP